MEDQRSIERTDPKENEKLLGFTEMSGHVGSSYDPAISKLPANSSRACFKSPFKRNRLVHKGEKVGPDGPKYFNGTNKRKWPIFFN